MKPAPRFPASYENVPVRRALETLAATPDLETLDALLRAALTGGLVVDVTGSTPETGTHVRTIASTDGRPVLPLFTSMKDLEHAIGQTGAAPLVQVQATIIPARQALELITSDDFIAVQFNPGGLAQVVVRAHIEAALEGRTPADPAS